MTTPPYRPSSVLRRPSYFLLAALVVLGYILVAYIQNGAFGFPLDDAWIHQVYARNLGTRLEFSFYPGQPSAGSTSPLWAVMLAIGYALHLDYRVWTTFLGILFLSASAWAAGRMTQHLTDDARLVHWLVPIFILLEWHLVWAAASGMEIMLFIFLALLLAELFWSNANAFLLGIIAGLLTLTRPEGMVLVALIAVGLAAHALRDPQDRRRSLSNQTLAGLLKLLPFTFAFLVLLSPYLWFNLETSGTLLPNTVYAKAAEYAALTTSPNFFLRWLTLYRQPFIGAQLLLVPGLFYLVWRLARERKLFLLLPAAWILLLPALYAWRLPVEYQFGRYLMPIIPFTLVYGIVGTAFLFQRISSRILRRAWALIIAALLIVFFFLGANLYAQSVGIVNCEMVGTADWTRANLPQGALIALHDIGAQGYFDPRPTLDTAGLVSPEVIPFIRNEGKLLDWMQARGAHYAIFFPTWYPQLAGDSRLQEIHSTDCALTKSMGEENLRVYELH